MSKGWLYLLFAGLLEICWAIGLKYSEGFSRLWPSLFTIFGLVGSMYLLSRATQTLPMGTAYALWVGIGAVGTCLFGMLFLNEPFTVLRLFFLVMLVISLIGLKMTAV